MQSGGHIDLHCAGSLTVQSLCSKLSWFLNDTGSLIYIKQVTVGFPELKFPLAVLKVKSLEFDLNSP